MASPTDARPAAKLPAAATAATIATIDATELMKALPDVASRYSVSKATRRQFAMRLA